MNREKVKKVFTLFPSLNDFSMRGEIYPEEFEVDEENHGIFKLEFRRNGSYELDWD